MRQEWFVQNKGADFMQLSKKFNISPITARLIRNRGIVEEKDFEKYLYADMSDMYEPFFMKDMDKAVGILKNKLDAGKKVRIVGDYDIDGVCASHILCSFLKESGMVVDVDIPHRIIDGYGISKRLVENAFHAGVDTIITCDNGIAANSAIDYARSLGMTIIITDHHEIPFEECEGNIKYILPDADAIINPKQEECHYPFKELCGAAVAYKLGVAFLKSIAYDDLETLSNELIVFCALATVGDIMPLIDENRIIVKAGLDKIAKVKNIGLRALININKLDIEKIDTYHFGFVLGPCINAAGRLDSALLAYKLFAEGDENEALKNAIVLYNLNNERKDMTQKGVDKAIELVEQEPVAPIIFVNLKDIHESVAGIVAGKLKERYHKPAFVLTESEGVLKGSARSIESYDMFKKMQECRNLYIKFGGHKMAAGFSIEYENFEKVKDFLTKNCGLSESDFIEKVSIDFQLPIEYVGIDLIKELETLAPFGNGNPEPVFVERDLNVYSIRRVGEKQNVLQIDLLMKDMRHMKAICFKDVDVLYQKLQKERKLTCVYAPKINVFRNTESVQLNIEYFR